MFLDFKNQIIYTNIWEWEELSDIEDFIVKIRPRYFIYNCLTEYEINIQANTDRLYKFNNILKDSNCKCKIFVGSSNSDYYVKHNTLSNIKYICIPKFWLIFFKEQYLNFKPFSFNKDIKNLFINLNRIGRTHRKIMIDYLYKNNLLEENVVSWLDIHKSFNYDYKFKFWKEEKIFLDLTKVNDTDFNISLPDQYYTTLFDLVSESTWEVPFFTEKTVRPISLKKPFILYGAYGIHDALRSLGFKLFDDVVNYDFDKESDLEKRAELISLELKRLSMLDFDSIKNKLEDVCEYNYHHLVNLKHDLIDNIEIDIGYLNHRLDNFGSGVRHFNDIFKKE